MTLLNAEPTIEEQLAEIPTLIFLQNEAWDRYSAALGSTDARQWCEQWESACKARGDAEYQLFKSMRSQGTLEVKTGVFTARIERLNGSEFVRIYRKGQIVD